MFFILSEYLGDELYLLLVAHWFMFIFFSPSTTTYYQRRFTKSRKNWVSFKQSWVYVIFFNEALHDLDVSWSLKVQTLCCIVFPRVPESFLFTAAAAATTTTTTTTTINYGDK